MIQHETHTDSVLGTFEIYYTYLSSYDINHKEDGLPEEKGIKKYDKPNYANNDGSNITSYEIEAEVHSEVVIRFCDTYFGITIGKDKFGFSHATGKEKEYCLFAIRFTMPNCHDQLLIEESRNKKTSYRDFYYLTSTEPVSIYLEALRNANKEIKAKDEKIAELETELKETADKIAAEYEPKIADLQNQLNIANNKILDLQNQIDELTALNSALEERNRELLKQIDELNDLIKIYENRIRELEEQIKILQDQIKNSSGGNKDLAEQLARAKEELNKLNNDILARLQKIEKQLDSTTDTSNLNKEEIAKMQKSLVADINSVLGTPRFGVMPLPIAKQALATNFELLEDASTGHVYFKNGNKLVSKTVENEENIFDLNERFESSFMGITINSNNCESFINDSDTNIYYTASNEICSKNNKIELTEAKFNYDPLLNYSVGIRMSHGAVKNVYFVDDNGNKLPCNLLATTGIDFIYQLTSKNINLTNIYPVIELDNAQSVNTVTNISICKERDIDNINNLKHGGNNNSSFGGPNIDSSLIDPITIVNSDGTFTVDSSHPIVVKIPKDALMEGTYSLILRTRNNTNDRVNVTTVFDGRTHDNTNVPFAEASYIAGGKTSFCDLTVPTYNTNNNYIRISSTNQLIIEYFLIKIVDINIYNYYTRNQVDKKDIIYCGKTTNSGNSYTAKNSLITEMFDGLTIRAKINANSTGNAYLQINNFGFFPILTDKQKNVKDLMANSTYHFCFNLEKRNFIALGKGGEEGIPESGIKISDTSLDGFDVYLALTILNGGKINDHKSGHGSEVQIVSEEYGVVLIRVNDWGPRNVTDDYYALVFNPTNDKVISLIDMIKNKAKEVGCGRYSTTKLYKLANRFVFSISHQYTSDGSSDRGNEIYVFDPYEKIPKQINMSSYGSIKPFKLAYDCSYVLFRYNAARKGHSYYITKMALTDNCKNGYNQLLGETDFIDAEVITFSDTIDYLIVNGTDRSVSNNVYKVFLHDANGDGFGQYVGTYTADWSSIAMCGQKTAYIYKNNEIYYIEFVMNGTNLSYRVLKTIAKISRAEVYRNKYDKILFSNGLNCVELDMSGNYTIFDSETAHLSDNFNGYNYSSKELGSYTTQVFKKPIKIYPKK